MTFRFVDRWQTSLGRLLRPDHDPDFDQFLSLAERRDRDLETFVNAPALGFHYENTTAAPAPNPGAAAALVFDTEIRNVGGWTYSAGTFTVPFGAGGRYHLIAEAYWVVAAPNFLSITRAPRATGTFKSIGQMPGAHDRSQVSANEVLEDGDTLQVLLYNASGGVITVTAYAGDALTPAIPYFKCYRIGNS